MLVYHLHPVVEWYQQNCIPSYIDSSAIRAGRNPLGANFLHFWMLKFFRDITWIELPQLFYGIIFSLSAYTIMLKLKLRRHTSLRYALLISFIPGVILHFKTCKDHLLFTTVMLICVVYFINVFYEKENEQLLFLFIAFALLFGLKKHSALVIFTFFPALLLASGFKKTCVLEFLKRNYLKIISGFLIMAVYGGYFIQKNPAFYSMLLLERPMLLLNKLIVIAGAFILLYALFKWGFRNTWKQRIIRNKKVIITIVLTAVVLGGSYGIIKYKGLLKTVLLTHTSPADTIASKSFRKQYPVLDKLPSNLVKNILVFPYRVKDLTAYTPELQRQSGFGVQFFVFGLLAYVLAFLQCLFRKEYRQSIAGFLTIFSILLILSYFLYYYSNYSYRLYIFFPVIGIILWAYFLSKWELPGYFRKTIDFLLLVMILFNIAATLFGGNGDANRWKTLITINNSRERTTIKFSSNINNRDDWKYIDEYIPPREPIGYLSGADSWILPYFDNQLKRRIYNLKSLPGYKRKIKMDSKGKKKNTSSLPPILNIA
ncbi:MAG: YfhO family protein [bacterium]|nr:YfhO family protein [bacterium]